MDEQQRPKINMDELRKKYPRMGKRWDKEEDDKLKKMYQERRAAGFGDFDAFVFELVKEFGRAAGGLKARMAMHFQDVPGWDYGRAEFREEELNKQVAEKIKPEHDELLKQEYQKYLEGKRETYLSFIKRLSERLGGIEGKLIRHKLEQLVGTVEKYDRDAVGGGFGGPKRISREPEIPQLNLSENPEMQ